MSIALVYVECDYWVVGYAVADEFCNVTELEGPFMGRKKKKKRAAPIMEVPALVRKNDDDLVMAIVEFYLED